MLQTRATKYTDFVREYFTENGHASNSQVLRVIRHQFPALSATTVHRITARLQQNGILAAAPPTKDGCLRYDINTADHDHFVCDGCDRIMDIDVAGQVIPQINQKLEGCRIEGRLVVRGTCEQCSDKEQK